MNKIEVFYRIYGCLKQSGKINGNALRIVAKHASSVADQLPEYQNPREAPTIHALRAELEALSPKVANTFDVYMFHALTGASSPIPSGPMWDTAYSVIFNICLKGPDVAPRYGVSDMITYVVKESFKNLGGEYTEQLAQYFAYFPRYKVDLPKAADVQKKLEITHFVYTVQFICQDIYLKT